MTTLDDWRALQRDVDAATGPNERIDADIWRLIPDMSFALPVTASLDAVTALIEREMPKYKWFIEGPLLEDANGKLYYAVLHLKTNVNYYEQARAEARSPALALLSALIRAKIAGLEQSEAAA